MHQSWRKGEKYVKSRRLQLEDPLLHKSGEPTEMGLIGLRAGKDGWKAAHKENDSPSVENQDGRIIGEPQPKKPPPPQEADADE